MTERLTVKAIQDGGDEWALDVLGIPYGGPNAGKDSQGEYFTPETELWLDQFQARPVVYYHGLGERKAAEIIGREVSYEKRADGVWFRVILDQTKKMAAQVWQAAQAGMARASSGALAHLVRTAADGQITVWPMGELSLMDGRQHQPANQYAVALPAAKAAFTAAGLEFTLDDDSSQGDATGEQQEQPPTAIQEAKSTKARMRKTMDENAEVKNTLTREEAAQLAKDAAETAIKAERERAEAEKIAAEERETEKQEAVQAARAEWEADAAKANRLPFNGSNAAQMAEFGELRKFDNLDARDLSVMLGVLEAAARSRRAQAPSEAAYKALVLKLNEDTGPVGVVGRNALKAMGAPTDERGAIKANEVNYTTQTSYGKEWVSAAWSQTLWEAIRLGTGVASRVPAVEIPQGASTLTVPLEGTDPVFYKIGQVTGDAATGGLSRPLPTVPSSKLGTANKTITASAMGARVRWSDFEDEDSLIPFAPRLRSQLETVGMEYMDHVLIDGDTETASATNINDIGGTPAGTEAFMILNGFRKLALVTNTANSRSAGALTSDDYLTTSQLLGAAGIYGLDRQKISYVIDPNVYYATLRNVTEVKTKDVWGASTPTIESGVLTQLWGTGILPAHMHYAGRAGGAYAYKANAAGKVDLDAAYANNTTGSILAVRWDRWLLGYKRRMRMEVDRDIESGTNVIVATMRFGMIYFDTDAAAISYNVTV